MNKLSEPPISLYGLLLIEAGRTVGESPDNQAILACQNMGKADEARAQLIRRIGNQAILAMELGVSLLASVQSFVEVYQAQRLPAPYGLVSKAGISGIGAGQSSEGFDIVFVTNHLERCSTSNSYRVRLSCGEGEIFCINRRKFRYRGVSQVSRFHSIQERRTSGSPLVLYSGSVKRA